MISQSPIRSIVKCFILVIALLISVLPPANANNETISESSTASISLENIMFDTDSVQHKEVVLTVRNLGDKVAQLDRIFINGRSFAREIKVDPGKALDISQNFDWKGYESYIIKLSGPDGLRANVTAISPSVEEERDPAMLLLIIISFFIFASLILIGGWTPTNDNFFKFNLKHGQIRSAIAGTLVFGFVILTFFSLYYPLNEGTIFNQFSQVVGIIIGFYFGSRTAASPGSPPGKSTDSDKASKQLQDDLEIARKNYDEKVIEDRIALKELERSRENNDTPEKIEEADKALKKATEAKEKARVEYEKKIMAIRIARSKVDEEAESAD